MNTVALNEYVAALLTRDLTPEQVAKVAIRCATPNKVTGRCLFDFDRVPQEIEVLVAAVIRAGKTTGTFYVVPRRVAPLKLLLRPDSQESKWWAYSCHRGTLTQTIQRTLAFTPSPELLARIS